MAVIGSVQCLAMQTEHLRGPPGQRRVEEHRDRRQRAVALQLRDVVENFLSPLDGLGWRDALLDYLHPASGRRAAQLARLRHFEVAGWQAHFSRVRSFMAGLALG